MTASLSVRVLARRRGAVGISITVAPELVCANLSENVRVAQAREQSRPGGVHRVQSARTHRGWFFHFVQSHRVVHVLTPLSAPKRTAAEDKHGRIPHLSKLWAPQLGLSPRSCKASDCMMRLHLLLLVLELWGNVRVSLSENACATLPDVPHGHLAEAPKTKYQEEDVIHFTCEVGYISGLHIRYKCTSDGWAAVNQGHCFLKPCPLPENTPNGYYQLIQGEDFVFGATIKYSCNAGYQMVSKIDTRTCLLEKWTNHVPICEPMRCDPPPAQGGITITGLPENEEGILPDHFLKFSCDLPGKQLSGSSLLVCGQDGVWDQPFPSCEDISCQVEELHLHLTAAELPPGNKTIRTGHKLRFRCGDGYALVGAEEIECLPTGQWNKLFPTCTEPCQVSGIPASVRLGNGVQGTQARKGQKLTFYCRLRGQMLQGKAEVECLTNGQWSDPFPTCGAPSECERPPHLAGGDTESSTKFSYKHNDRVKYICQNYYVMDGGPYMTCNNGQWVGQMKCLKPCTVDRELMSTHKIAFRYTRDNKLYSAHDDIIEFRCASGTSHDGVLNMRQKCTDGEMELPTCQ